MISRDIKVFIDGRAELYGEQFVLDYFDATGARNLGELLGTLVPNRCHAAECQTPLPPTLWITSKVGSASTRMISL